MPDVRIGISGWTYPPWRGVFYPAGMAHRRELEFASRQLNSIEINGSFYALQRPRSFHAWREVTPADFVFSVKGGRFITHMKKLRDVDAALANFVGSGLLALEEKLGPLLWQLPPNLGFDERRLDDFFARLPRSTAEAAYLARHHDDRIDGRAWTATASDRPLRHCLEVRHDSFKAGSSIGDDVSAPALLDVLRRWQVGLVVADTAGKWPQLFDVTSDFVYVRLHGADELYVSGYTPQSLDGWADRIRAWTAQGLDVYVYFDNDVKVRAPFDAMALAHRLQTSTTPSWT